MDDLDALLDLEGAAFGDDDEGVFEDGDVCGGPSIKAGKEGEKETRKAVGGARCRRHLEKRWRLTFFFCSPIHLTFDSFTC